jgi:hypothetical protein
MKIRNHVKQGEVDDRKAGMKRRASSWGGKDSRRQDRHRAKLNIRRY